MTTTPTWVPVPESQFTAPTVDCPEPELWTAWDGQSAEREVTSLVAAFVAATKPRLAIETGTGHGNTAAAIGAALFGNGRGHLHTMEIDSELADEARSRCVGLPVTVHKQSSLLWTPPEPIGFAWFDSLVQLRAPEFRLYYDSRHGFAEHAIVGFHDCGPQHPLRPLIEELASDRLIRPIYLPTPRGVIFAEVL